MEMSSKYNYEIKGHSIKLLNFTLIKVILECTKPIIYYTSQNQ